MDDLIFQRPPKANPAELLFGEVDASGDSEIHIVGSLPGLQGVVLIGRHHSIMFSGTLAGLVGPVDALYKSETDRPLVGEVAVRHQVALPIETEAAATHQVAERIEGGAQTMWSTADVIRSTALLAHRDADRRRQALSSAYQDADRLRAGAAARHAEMLRDRRLSVRPRHQDAAPMRSVRRTGWQDRYRDRRPSLGVRWAEALPVVRGVEGAFSAGLPLRAAWRGRYQNARRPPAGTRPPVVPPGADPCYLPALPVNLLFTGAYTPNGNLLFVCERHSGGPPPPPGSTVVVPIRRVYLVLNTIMLRRVEGDILMPALSFAMTIDADSWTWSWAATLPTSALSNLEPSGAGEPVELEATINGVAYRLIAERLSSERTFGRNSLKVSGRGRNAVLADPYAPRKSFSAAGDLTAQQLAEDALTDNGIPIGWGVDWQIEDWFVPGGTWSHQGTYLTALQAIARAAGGYVQPHRVAQSLRVMHMYPYAPWDWGGVTPDYELPSDVVGREAIEWTEKPIYNRVFVSGQRNGLLGQITRAGTAGDAIAPAVVEPLATAIEALRQRGRAVLSDVGRQAAVSLRLPVLSETGLILPGAFVRYVDGATTRIGLVRTTALNGDLPQLRQTLGVETHVAP